MSRAYDQIAASLLAMTDDAGQWRPCWHRTGLTMPRNAVTRHIYRGVNVLSLWVNAELRGYTRNLWATYQQWASIDAQVKKGEKGTPVVVFRTYDTEDDNGEKRHAMYARGFTVFNAAQVDGFPDEPSPPANPDAAVEHAEAFVSATGAAVTHSPDHQPQYRPAIDAILLPPFETFHSAVGYYGALLHELTHWTGHQSRCARELCGRFNDAAYAFEELVAELGAAFLCADLHLEQTPRSDHAQYLAHWHRALEREPAAFMRAVALAGDAAAYLHALQPEARRAAAA